MQVKILIGKNKSTLIASFIHLLFVISHALIYEFGTIDRSMEA